MTDKKTQLIFFRKWCMSCKRLAAQKKLHGNRNGGTFECNDITCPAQRRTNGMELGPTVINEYVNGSKLRLIKKTENDDA